MPFSEALGFHFLLNTRGQDVFEIIQNSRGSLGHHVDRLARLQGGAFHQIAQLRHGNHVHKAAYPFHEFRHIDELGETLHRFIGAGGVLLQIRLHLSEHGSPTVKGRQTVPFQPFGVHIAHDRVQFGHGVGDGRARGQNVTAAGALPAQPFQLGVQVEGHFRSGRVDALHSLPIGHEIQLAEHVGFVHIKKIDPHVLEKDRLILGLGKTRLDAAFGLFQALLQTGSGNAVVAVRNGLFKLGDEVLCRGFQGFRPDADALERRMRDHNGVRSVQGGLRHKTPSVVAGKILLVRHHDPRQRIGVLKLRRELAQHVVGHHIHGALNQAEAPLFHAGNDHFQSLPRPHGMGEIDVPCLDDAPDGPLLVVVQLVAQRQARQGQV